MTNLTSLGLTEGIWEALVAADDKPALVVEHDGTPLADTEVKAGPEDGQWLLRVPVPASALSDGIQIFRVLDGDGATLGQFEILAGAPLATDIRAELALLRAELDLLKSAFRRHCAESS
ncbi:hypothetical protein AADZ90_000170 [Aestuariibius sp. 2305UL40-4]|uniref:hypothetical protein n=1 Tax=Aestuariibius violaceus TaxID=3234132 RepID=UPI00345E0E8D